MTTFQKYKTFVIKANDTQIVKLINLNKSSLMFRRIDVNVISCYKLNGKWLYIVGIYNDPSTTYNMNAQFEKNLCNLKLTYKKYYSIGIFGFTNETNNTDSLLSTIGRINTYLTMNNIDIVSFNYINGSPSPIQSADITLFYIVSDFCKTIQLLNSFDIIATSSNDNLIINKKNIHNYITNYFTKYFTKYFSSTNK
jgi:hypothetical protein